MISLDISNAFNRAWTPFGLENLVSWGINGHILHFMKNFLTNRSSRLVIGDAKSTTFNEVAGVLLSTAAYPSRPTVKHSKPTVVAT